MTRSHSIYYYFLPTFKCDIKANIENAIKPCRLSIPAVYLHPISTLYLKLQLLEMFFIFYLQNKAIFHAIIMELYTVIFWLDASHTYNCCLLVMQRKRHKRNIFHAKRERVEIFYDFSLPTRLSSLLCLQ